MQQTSDRRRFNAPEGSQPLQFNKASASSSKSALLTADGLRADGRHADQVRPICEQDFPLPGYVSSPLPFAVLQTGLVSEASGSAYIETGRTKMMCAVYVQSCCLRHFDEAQHKVLVLLQVWTEANSTLGAIQRTSTAQRRRQIRSILFRCTKIRTWQSQLPADSSVAHRRS